MNSQTPIEILERANPFTSEPTRSVDAAWNDLQSRLTESSGLKESDGRISHRWRVGSRRTLVAVAAAAVLLLVIGVGVVVRPFGSSKGTVSIPSTTFGAFRLASDSGPSVAPFESTGGSPQGIGQMACPTATTCFIVSQTSTPGPSTAPVQEVTTVYRSTDSGVSWQTLTIPSGVVIDTPLSCVSASWCMVGAQSISGRASAPQDVLITSDGGATWVTELVPLPGKTITNSAQGDSVTSAQGTLYSLQCFSQSSCIGFGLVPFDQPEEPVSSTGNGVLHTVVVRTSNSGGSWSSTTIPWSTTPSGAPAWSNAQHAAFSCASPSQCLGLATVLGQPDASGNQSANLLQLRSSDGGTTWTSNWLPTLGGAVSDLTCHDANNCVATATVGAFGSKATGTIGVMATSDGGATWVVREVFPSSDVTWDGLTSISCPSVSTCWVSGYQKSTTRPGLTEGAMFVTRDGGLTWLSAQIPANVGSVTQVDCNAAESCLALAQPPIASGTSTPSGPIPSILLTIGSTPANQQGA